MMPKGKAVTIHRNLVMCFVTKHSLRDGIVLWELQEQKCQQRVCQHTDVVQTGQAGWMVLILQWMMMKFPGRSALAIVPLVADIQTKFQLKIVDHFTSTNLLSPVVVGHATAARTKSGSNNFTNSVLYSSPLLIVILNTIVKTWCILANFYVEPLNVLIINISNDDGYQRSFPSFTKTSCLKK